MKNLKLSLLVALFSATFANAKTVELCADGEFSAIGQTQSKLIVAGAFGRIGRCTTHGAMKIPLNGETWGKPVFYDQAPMGYSHFADRGPGGDGYVLDTQVAGDIDDAEYRMSWLHEDGSVKDLGLNNMSARAIDIDGDNIWAIGFSEILGVNAKTGQALKKIEFEGTIWAASVHDHVAYVGGSDFKIAGVATPECTARVDLRSGKVEALPNGKFWSCGEFVFNGDKLYRLRGLLGKTDTDIVEYDSRTLKEIRVVATIVDEKQLAIETIANGILFVSTQDEGTKVPMALLGYDLKTGQRLALFDGAKAPIPGGSAWVQVVDGLIIFQSPNEYTFPDGSKAWVVACHLSTGLCEPMAGRAQGFSEAPRMIYADRSGVLFGPISSMDLSESVSVAAFDLDTDTLIPIHAFKFDEDFIPFSVHATADPQLMLLEDPTRAAALDLNTGTLKWNLKAGKGALVTALPYRDKVAFGGDFLRLGTKSHPPYFLSAELNDGAPSTWHPMPDKSVNALAYDSATDALWLAGDFTKVGDSLRPGIAGFDSAGKILPQTWGIKGSLESMHAWNGSLFFAGDIYAINGTPMKSNLVKVNAVTGAVENWRANLNFETWQILPFDDENLLAYSDGLHPSLLVNKRSGATTPFYPDLFGAHEIYAAVGLKDRPGFAAAQVQKLTIVTP